MKLESESYSVGGGRGWVAAALGSEMDATLQADRAAGARWLASLPRVTVVYRQGHKVVSRGRLPVADAHQLAALMRRAGFSGVVEVGLP